MLGERLIEMSKIADKQQEEIERLNNIIKELKVILKSKGYETYIPVLERSDEE